MHFHFISFHDLNEMMPMKFTDFFFAEKKTSKQNSWFAWALYVSNIVSHFINHTRAKMLKLKWKNKDHIRTVKQQIHTAWWWMFFYAACTFDRICNYLNHITTSPKNNEKKEREKERKNERKKILCIYSKGSHFKCFVTDRLR